ncbi:MAG TPA: MFS transporter [Tabrizicola sp.]|nr:MFS transporter [Tabrizicola sp.]
MSVFHRILANNLLANITNFTAWFAITFWVFLETGSVFATGMIAGIYLTFTGLLGIWLGAMVDHHGKIAVMAGSSLASLVFFALSLGLMHAAPDQAFTNPYGVWLWALVLLVMGGVIAGNIRGIALPTVVTLLFPEDGRDKANGLVGMVSGIGFLVTSAVSGFLVAWGGMELTLIVCVVASLVALLDIRTVRLSDPATVQNGRTSDEAASTRDRKIDLRGTIKVVAGVPGLFALILFAMFNNFLGGIFMALLDAYGLSLVSVEVWGLTFAVLSSAFIFGGLAVAKFGLGKNPVRTLLMVNVVVWAVASVFAIQASFALLVAGCFLWMALGPVAEAAEQTALQKVVPLERQGRVFGFAQSMEQAASPLTAFLIGPLTQFVVIPFMTDGAGARSIGSWFGTGPDRGIALVFTVAGLVGVLVAVLALRSRSFHLLSARYLNTDATIEDEVNR